jgi:hypothetical protein
MTELLHDHLVVPSARSDAELSDYSRVDLSPVPCAYCWEPIPADAFDFWSQAKRVLSAACPCCDRRMTLTAATWRRWSGPDHPRS